MKQIVFHASKGVVIEDIPGPVCQDCGALIKVSYSLISSGTESVNIGVVGAGGGTAGKILKNVDRARKVIKKVVRDGVGPTMEVIDKVRNKTIPLGYSASGEVLEVGRCVTDLSVGDKVACGGMGFANHAELIYVPRNLLVKLPEGAECRDACFTTVASVALQGVRRMGIALGENVVVMGLGLIGLLAVQLLKIAGARIIGFDLNQKRVDLAKQLGATETHNLNNVDPIAVTEAFTKGYGADCVLLAAQTPSDAPLNLSMQLTKTRGRVVYLGAVGMNLTDVENFYSKEIDIVGSHAYGPGRYDPQYELEGIDYPIGYVRWTLNRNMEEIARLLHEKQLDVSQLIDREFPVEEAIQAYELFSNRADRPVGVVLRYSEEIGQKLNRKYTNLAVPTKKGELNGAIIGCGNWSELHHLPNMMSMPGVQLKAIMGNTGFKIKQTAEKHKVPYCTTDYSEILKDPDIDFVIIGTRNNSHYAIAKSAVEAGKHVLLEKPMTVTSEEMDDLVSTVEKSKTFFGVGFNRRYSPFARTIKSKMGSRKTPVMILYRINGGPHAKGFWVYDEAEGGGLIVGEACHYFDFFNYMIESEIVDFKVNGLSVDRSAVFNVQDNVVVTVQYADNSVASLFYSSLGPESLEKEYIEVHHNNSVSIIRDYKKLDIYGPSPENIILKQQDKGMRTELEEFVKLIRGESSQFISLKDSVRATKLCFDVVDQLKQPNNVPA